VRRKYLVISPCFPPPFVGGSKVWTYNMVEYGPEGFDILTSGLKPGQTEICGPKHRAIRTPQLWDENDSDPSLWDLFRSYAYIFTWFLFNARKYDAVVVGVFVFANGWLFLLGRLLGVPVIGLGNAEEFTLALKGKGFKNAVKRWLLRATHPKAAGFIVVCHFCRDVLAEVGVDPAKVDIVPSSINANKLHPRTRKAGAGHHVLSVGRLVERKGFHLLAEAVASLRGEFPDIELTIVGDGPYRETLEARIRELNAGSFVHVRKRLTDDELAQCYADADLFVLAHMMLDNGDTEGCPTVFSEASGSGLPVIGGLEGGASTVIVEGRTGFIVDSRNVPQLAARIRQILSDPAMAESMGRAGIEKIRRDHTPERTAEQFLESVMRFAHTR
jgi:glycosyltransferase involved in cell wall biosynthesis